MAHKYDDFNESVVAKFRANNGVVQGWGDGLLLVHHRGAKSGIERISPAMSLRDDDGSWLIAASAAGAAKHPAWYFNLRANPDTVVEAAGEGEVAVHVTELEGTERDAAWARFEQLSPGFAQYQSRTERTIPVLRLQRR
ncbi:nitroreductase/quinone reductase family protein [Microbacterium sp. YY-01]|uniref:nitroreductase/quinone reductase family protein n=1 Tax=Microbacterium sp. YY-01 TaxID=3421634 RepID=UPI003D16EABE